MGIIHGIERNDVRIRTELQKWFPEMPEFIEYLYGRIIAYEGSIVVAELLGKELSPFLTKGTQIGREAIQRLGIDGENSSLRQLVVAMEDPTRTIYLLAGRFQWQMQIQTQFVQAGTNETGEPTFIEHKLIDPECYEDLLRLYYCALAMLLEIKIDPKKQSNAA